MEVGGLEIMTASRADIELGIRTRTDHKFDLSFPVKGKEYPTIHGPEESANRPSGDTRN